MEKAERAVSDGGHSIVEMADFAANDQAPAAVCEQRVRDQPEVSYTELEFITATYMGFPRLMFVYDTYSEDHEPLINAVIDRKYGDCQDAFLSE